ncbi:hypothetical protein B566_EDAN018430 [Ephemera danica]|nr:hypothetical protein B566_EDAN018430 [Ephemera danica]
MARGFLAFLNEFRFNFLLQLFSTIFAHTDKLYETLQKKGLELNVCITRLNETREFLLANQNQGFYRRDNAESNDGPIEVFIRSNDLKILQIWQSENVVYPRYVKLQLCDLSAWGGSGETAARLAAVKRAAAVQCITECHTTLFFYVQPPNSLHMVRGMIRGRVCEGEVSGWVKVFLLQGSKRVHWSAFSVLRRRYWSRECSDQVIAVVLCRQLPPPLQPAGNRIHSRAREREK